MDGYIHTHEKTSDKNCSTFSYPIWYQVSWTFSEEFSEFCTSRLELVRVVPYNISDLAPDGRELLFARTY